MFELWKNALLKPKQTFKAEKKNAKLALGAKYILVSGLITAAITALSYLAGLDTTLDSLFLYPALVLLYIIFSPVLSVIGWLFSSGVDYIFAKLLGGRGTYEQQTYLISLYVAPISIISAVLLLVPVAGLWLSALLSLYGLYLVTMALKEAHGYSTGRAVLTWLIPFLIVVVFAMILAAAIAFWFSGFAMSETMLI